MIDLREREMESMDNPKEPPGTEVRRTLKLKAPSGKTKLTAPRAPAPAVPVARPASAAPPSREPGTWADVYKKKMQADMDALGFGEDLSARGSPRR
jgi:hypothetical protein